MKTTLSDNTVVDKAGTTGKEAGDRFQKEFIAPIQAAWAEAKKGLADLGVGKSKTGGPPDEPIKIDEGKQKTQGQTDTVVQDASTKGTEAGEAFKTSYQAAIAGFQDILKQETEKKEISIFDVEKTQTDINTVAEQLNTVQEQIKNGEPITLEFNTEIAKANLEEMQAQLDKIKANGTSIDLQAAATNYLSSPMTTAQQNIANLQTAGNNRLLTDEEINQAKQALDDFENKIQQISQDHPLIDVSKETQALEQLKAQLEGVLQSDTHKKSIITFEETEKEIENVKANLEKLKTADVSPEQLKSGLEEAKNKIAELEAKLKDSGMNPTLADKLKDDLEEAKKKAQEVQERLDGIKGPHLENLEKFQRGAYGLSTAINMIAMAINKSSSAGRILSGVLMGVAGVLRIISAIGKEDPFVAIASGILMIVNGVATAVETPQETLERLQKTAEDLSNKAKQVKQDYKTIKEAKQKYEDLKETRYESEEAAEEYKNAVDELANKFPELIQSIDEAGEITLNQSKLEEVLAKAREATAKATYEAIKAEYDAKKQEIETKKSQILKDSQAIFGQAELGLANSQKTTMDSAEHTFEYLFENNQDVRALFTNPFGRSFQLGMGIETPAQKAGEKPGDYFARLLSNDTYQESVFSAFKNKTWDEIEAVLPESASDDLIESVQLLYEAVNIDAYNKLISELQSDASDLSQMTDVESAEYEASVEHFIIKYQELQQKFPNLAKQLLDDNTQLGKLLQDLEELGVLNIEATSLGKATFSEWVRGLQSTRGKKNWSILSDESKMMPLVTEALAARAGDTDYLEFQDSAEGKKAAEKIVDAMQQDYDAVTGARAELLDRMLSNMEDYTASDFIALFEEETGPISDETKAAFQDYYNPGNQARKDRLQKYAQQQIGGIENADYMEKIFLKLFTDSDEVIYEFTDSQVAFLTSMIAQYESLKKSGFGTRASQYGVNMKDLWATLQELENPETRAALFDFIKENGITSKEDIDAILGEAKRLGVSEQEYTELEQSLSGVRDSIIENLNLAINSSIHDFVDKWGDKSKTLKKMTSGMDFSEVQALIDMASTFEGFELGLSDFKSNGKGQLVLTAEKSQAFWEAYIKSMQSQTGVWQEELDKASSILGLEDFDSSKGVPFHSSAYNETEREAIATILGVEKYNKYFDKDGNFIGESQEEFWIALVEAQKAAQQGIEDANAYYQWAEEQILTEQQWKAGNYSSLQLKEGDFERYLKGEDKYDAKENPAIATAVKQVQSGVSDFLSGLLTTGFEDFNITDYAESGIEESIFQKMQNDLYRVQNGLMSYETFISEYAQYTGKTASEMESLIAQAHAKDYEGNVYEGFSEIVGSYEKFSYEAGQKFAKSLGTSVEDLISKGIIDVDAVTGDLSIEYDKLKLYLAENMRNMSIKQYNELRAKLDAAENKQSDATILGEVIQNRHKLSEENVASLATLLGIDYSMVLDYLTKNADGTYNLDLSTIETLIRTGQIKVTEEVIELIDNEIDTILSTLTGLGSIQGKGTTKIEDMRKRADAINQQLGTNYSLQDLFTYDTNLHAFVYSTEGLQIQARSLAEELENLKQNTEANADEIWAVQQSMKNIGIEMANNIDYSGFLSLAKGDPARWAKWQEVHQAIEDYNTVMAEMGQTMGLNADAIMASLTLGGDAAVVAIEAIAQAQGKTVSEGDVEAAYRAQVGQYVDAIDVLTAKPGEIIDATTASLIKTSGGAARELGNSGRYVVESAANLYEAYNQLLQMLKITGEATLAEINQVAALALENRDGEQSAIDALGDAAGMTYTRFGEILTEGGIELTEDLVNALETAGIIQSMGGNKMRITDFQAFADLMGWEPDSEEYVSAFRTYNDSMIELNRKTEQTILSEVKSLSGAKGGDWVNLTQFSTIFDKMLPSDTEGSGLTSILDIVNSKISQYGGYIEDGILKLEAGANIPAIIQEITATAAESGGLLTSEMAELADTLNEVLQAYADLIRNGISGTLTNSQAQQLQSWGQSLGVDIDFTQTKQGLKISTDSAIALYKELQKIDSIQADLVFEDLVEALSGDKGGKLSNVSKTSAEIAKIQKEIKQNEEKIQEIREHTHGDAADLRKIDNLQKQNSELREQISLYNQIAQRQSIDPNQYNFMDRDLPDTLQGPMNYWNSVGQAMEALNTASSSGKIGIQDFYNIVYEMENLANIAGTTFNWAGYTIGGEASQAAALIEKGMTALSNVDGKGVQIDLSKLGVQFVAGANSAKNNIESGVEALADSQIAMIDAAIKVLEVVVAMEGLSDIDVDNEMGFSFGDMFNLDAPPGGFTENGEAWYEFTEEYVAWQKKMIEKLTEGSDTYDKELDEAMSNIQINGKSLKELLKLSAKEVSELGIGQEGFFQVLKAFETAAASGDYNLDTIQDSVWEVLDAAGLTKDMTINVGDYTITVVGGTKALIDWSSPNTQQVLEDLQKHYGKDEEAARTYLTEAMVAFQQGKMTDPVQVLMVLHATGKIEIVYDDEGNPKIKVGDEEIDPKSKEGQEIIARETLKAKGLEDSDIWGERIDITPDGEEKVTLYGKTSIGEAEIEVTSDGEGNVVYKDTKYGLTASTLEELEDKIIDKILEDPGNSGKTRYQARQIAFGMDVEPKVTINTKIDTAEKKKAGIEFSETASSELADLVRAGGGSFSGETFKYTPSEDGQTVTIDYKGVQVTVENTGDVEKNIEAAQAEVAELVDADGLIEKITTAITNAFSGEAGAAITRAIVNGLLVVFGNLNLDGTNFTIPEVPVNIGNLKVGQVNKTTIGEGDQFGDLFNKNNINIDKVKAELKELDISKIGEVDVSEAESVGEEIVNKLQDFLDNNHVKIYFDKGNEPDKNPTSKEEPPANTSNRTNNGYSETNTTYGSKQPRDSAQINHIEPKGLSPEIEAALTLDTNPASTALEGFMSQLTGAFEGFDFSSLDISKMQEAADVIANVSSDAVQTVKDTVEGISTGPVEALAKASREISSTGAIMAKTAINSIKAPSTLKSDFKISVSSSAKGNVSLAKGTGQARAGGQRTLMGELGPELVVSNGQYFLVGENGAEFVDLAKDAIVFNHLQTERLLKNGSIGGYGRPVTNENNAVSRAKGTAMADGNKITKQILGDFSPLYHTINWRTGASTAGSAKQHWTLGKVEVDVPKETPKDDISKDSGAKGNISLAKGTIFGPAMASASEALAVLKQLRAMWQSLKDASLKDLGGMPGGSGGGGGGGGSNNSPKQIKAIAAEVERWYNWLAKIETTQNKINILTKQYTLLDKQHLSSQQKLNNLQEQYKKLQENKSTRDQLVKEQKAYRKQLAGNLNSSKNPFSAFYNMDANTGEINLKNDDNFIKFVKAQGGNSKLKKKLTGSGVITADTTIDYKHALTAQEAENEYKKAYAEWKKKNPKASQKEKDKKKSQLKEKFKEGKTVDRKIRFGQDIKTGRDLMLELQREDKKTGKKVHNAEEQFKILNQLGFMTKDIMADVDKSQEGWQETAVQNFYEAVESGKVEAEALNKSIQEQEEASLDDAAAMQEINEQIREIYKTVPGVTEGLEEWYNLNKKIAAEQNKINQLSKQNDIYQKDFIANGAAIFKNYQEQLASLQKQSDINKQLKEEQQKKKDRLVNKLNENAALKNFVTYDTATGRAYFNETKVKENKTYTASDKIALNEFGYQYDEYGRYIDDKGQYRDKEGHLIEAGAKFGKVKETKTINGKTYEIDENGQRRDSSGVIFDKNGKVLSQGFGQVQIEEGKESQIFESKGKTLDEILTALTETDAQGNMKYTAEEQYQILDSLGLAKFMKYDENGNQLYENFGELTAEQMKSAVEAGIARIQKTADDINDTQDAIDQTAEEDLELQSQMLELQQAQLDKVSSLQEQVRDAVVQEYQTLIDEKNELRDAIEKAADKTISGLRDSLEQDKKVYESDKDKTELKNLQMQLALLQKSNGSIAQIRDLEKKIQDKQQDIYWTERENAIDDLETIAQKQVEALTQQTDILQSLLDFQISTGLIWEQVNNKLTSMSPEELGNYIIEHKTDFFSGTPIAQAADLKNAIEMVDFFQAWNQDQKNSNDARDKLNVDNAINSSYANVSDLFTAEEKDAILKEAQNKFDTTAGSAEDKTQAANEYINQAVAERGEAHRAEQAKKEAARAAVDYKNSMKYGANAYDLEGEAKKFLSEGKTSEEVQAELKQYIEDTNKEIAVNNILKLKEIKEFKKNFKPLADKIDFKQLAEQAYDEYNGDIEKVKSEILRTIDEQRVKADSIFAAFEDYLSSRSASRGVFNNLSAKKQEQIRNDYLEKYINNGEDAANNFLHDTFSPLIKQAKDNDFNAAIGKKGYLKSLLAQMTQYTTEANAKKVLRAKYDEMLGKYSSKMTLDEKFDKLREDFKKNKPYSSFAKTLLKKYENGKYFYLTGTYTASKGNRAYNSSKAAQNQTKKESTVLKANKKITVNRIHKVSDKLWILEGSDGKYYRSSAPSETVKNFNRIRRFAQGGQINFTGPAWVDGTKQKPEYILNNDQMNFLKAGLLDNVKLTSSLLTSLQESLSGSAQANTYTNITNDNNASVNIGQASVNINVAQVANDYDARRIGQQALDEMVRIARKAGNNTISRR